MKRFIRGLVLLSLAGCCGKSLYSEKRVELQEDAASTHVAVLSVAPFEDYVSALLPKFSLTAEQALGQVVPTTRALEEKFLDALMLSLKVAPPTSTRSVAESTTTTAEGSGDPTSTSERTVESQKGPGDLSKVPQNAEFGKGLAAGALGPAPSVLSTTPSIEPMLRYTAANALFQEVQILNRYLRDAVVRENTRPLVVRLQISVMPMARHMPYDVFSNLSFFCTGKDGRDALTVPEVVPMLVTDNLEATMHSKSLDQVRQVSLGLAAMIHGFGGSADLQRKVEDLQTVLGRDLNSLLTVAKLSQNMLRVRLGAAQEVQSSYALVPQTHNVTVLLLVPKDEEVVRVRAFTRLRDAIRGSELRARDFDEVAEIRTKLREKYEHIARREGLAFEPRPEDLEALTTSAVTGEAAAFNAKMDEVIARKGPRTLSADEKGRLSSVLWWRDAFWEDLISFALGNRFSVAAFDVPKERPMELPRKTAGARVVLVDTGDLVRVLLPEGEHLRAEDLGAVLEWENRHFPSKALRVREGGRDLTVEFPSLAKFVGKDEVAMSVVLIGPRPKKEKPEDKEPPPRRETYDAVYYRISEAKPVGYSLQLFSSVVDVDGGKGGITMGVVFDDPRLEGLASVTLGLKGASLESAKVLEGGAVEVKDRKVVVKADGWIRIEATDLEDTVVVEALGSNGAKVASKPIQRREKSKKP